MPHRSVWSFSRRRLLALSSTIRTRLSASSRCSPPAAARSRASTSSAMIVKWTVEPILWDADSGVVHREVNLPPRALEPPSRDGHPDLACRCELDGVGQKVDEHLP